MSSDKKFVFEWQRGDSFLNWMLPTLISGLSNEEVSELSQLTDKWHAVELTMQINGRSVSPERFLQGIEQNMELFAKDEAERLIQDAVPGLSEIRDVADQARRDLEAHLRSKLTEFGVNLTREDDW